MGTEDEDEEEESDEEDLDSSGDESTWTWSGCSSRSQLLKLQHSQCKCKSCCNTTTCKSFLSSHFETRQHRLMGDLGVAGAKDCTSTSCGRKGAEPAARDIVPSDYPIEASGIFDTTFRNKLH